VPVAVSYPGVYIEEIPSGVHTITGVATSITAFIGRAAQGSEDATIINNNGDFERNFGSLDPAYPMGYAVRDFFANGGAQAVIVRLFHTPSGDGVVDRATITWSGLTLTAASRGSWANGLRIRVDANVAPDVATSFGLTTADLFNLTVRDTRAGTTERFVNLTVKESPRRVDRVLTAGSQLLRVAASVTLPGTTVPAAHAAPAADKTIWTDDNASTPVGHAAVDSAALATTDYQGSQTGKTGLFALDKTDLFNLLCIPPDVRAGDTNKAVYSSALDYCVQRRAMLIVDSPVAWTSANAIVTDNDAALTALGLSGERARNAALFFPRLVEPDPKRNSQLDNFVACGAIAGLMARTDGNRGVWKAPAGIDAALSGVQGLSVSLTNDENGQLNPLGVNCLRTFPIIGSVAWGARTMRGADLLADDYKYVPVRRTALYIEESLYRGLQWAVFEPNDEPLWAQIRLNVGAFMQNLFRQGAFQGSSPRDAYFVKCDKETTTQNDINLGIVNVIVGFAPLKPAEFVIIQLQQIAGQIAV
jgi:phage tail sheath protein FI